MRRFVDRGRPSTGLREDRDLYSDYLAWANVKTQALAARNGVTARDAVTSAGEDAVAPLRYARDDSRRSCRALNPARCATASIVNPGSCISVRASSARTRVEN